MISDLPYAAAMPASKAAFHCLYFSPKRTTTTSACSIPRRVRIALTIAPLRSCQNLSSSAPRIATPQSSLAAWSVTGASKATSSPCAPCTIRSRQSVWISPER